MASDHPPRYELDTTPPVSLPRNGDALPRTVTANQWDHNYMQQGVIVDEETTNFEEVMRRSEQDALRNPRRTNTGTDLDELELAYKLSLAG